MFEISVLSELRKNIDLAAKVLRSRIAELREKLGDSPWRCIEAVDSLLRRVERLDDLCNFYSASACIQVLLSDYRKLVESVLNIRAGLFGSASMLGIMVPANLSNILDDIVTTAELLVSYAAIYVAHVKKNDI